MVAIDDVLDRLDLQAAVDRELTTANRLMPPRRDRLALINQSPRLSRWLRDQYKRGRYGTPADVIFVDKNRAGRRPISEMSLADRVLYRALVTLIGESLPEHLVKRRSIVDFRESPLAEDSAKYISKTDVASYYEFVDHEILADELLAQTGEAPAIEVLMDLLGGVMGRRVGLPQVHRASDVLGDTYIDPVRRRLRRAGYHVYTFSDDFRIASPSLASARNGLEACAAEVRNLGLVLNEGKTFTYTVENYRASLTSFSDAERSLFAEDEADELFLLRDSRYGDGDESGADIFTLGDTAVQGGVADDDVIDVEVQVEDQAHSEVDEAQVHAARRAWSLWVGEDSSDEYRTGQTSAIAESLLASALPILGAAGEVEPLSSLSSVLRHSPALTPQVARYLALLGSTGRTARTQIRQELDRLAAEDSFSLWQQMWIAHAAGDFRRVRGRHEHYDWLVQCIQGAPPPLAATAAYSVGQLQIGDPSLLAAALDRVGPNWRTQALYGLLLLDEDAAKENSEDLIDRLLVDGGTA